MSFKSQKEIWEYLIIGGKVSKKNSNPHPIFLSKEGSLESPDGPEFYYSFSDFNEWSVYEEPKQPRKMLAFINNEDGYLVHALNGSVNCTHYLSNSLYSRAEGFDLIEKLGGEV